MKEDIKEILTALDNTTKKQLDEAITNADKEWNEMELEEDIKILEEFIEKNIKSGLRTELNANEFKAIENLITRYKELKTHYEIICDDLKEHNLIYTDTPEFEENYIPKSKVQERIEELQEGCKNCNFRGNICKEFKAFNQCTFQVTIKNLQELLED